MLRFRSLPSQTLRIRTRASASSISLTINMLLRLTSDYRYYVTNCEHFLCFDENVIKNLQSNSRISVNWKTFLYFYFQATHQLIACFCCQAKKRLEPGSIALTAWGRYTGYGCAWADPLDDPDEEVMSKIKNVYVTKLTDQVTEDDLRERFSNYGAVERVKKVTYPSCISKQDCHMAVFCREEQLHMFVIKIGHPNCRFS